MNIKDRFLRYVLYDTRSCSDSEQTPSTEGQRVFAEILLDELKDMGIHDVRMDEKGFVYGFIPSNIDKEVPTIGFIAHMDTVNDFPSPSKDHPPVLIEKYDGRMIELAEGIIMNPSENLPLKNSVGDDLILTDGRTILGADDKAGIAEIVTALEYIMEHPQYKHGRIAFAFTPDEEIGRGTEHFDVESFGADFAYTIDGAAFGEVEYENFNAATVKVQIKGTSTHPGDAKGKMVNAMLIGIELQNMLPAEQRPEHTEGAEGFFHLLNMTGDCDACNMTYIIRDVDSQLFLQKKDLIKNCGDFLNKKYGKGRVKISIRDGYRNMADMIRPHMHLIENARDAVTVLGGIPISRPMRGGTDGAKISYMGCPCPNLGTGSYGHHSVREFANLREMQQCTALILELIDKYAK